MRHPTVAQSGQSADWKKIRVIVFGLDDQFRFLVRQTFRKLNVRDVVSFDVPADLPALLAQGADVLLIDFASSAENGLAVLERVRRPLGNPHESLPVLAVAPSSLKDILERAKVLGIEGIIPKPISGHELGHRVGETLANPQRLAPPAAVSDAPKRNFIKEADPLPDLAPADAVAPSAAKAAEVIPEVAALVARLKIREEAAASLTDPRAERDGPTIALLGRSPSAVPAPAVSKPAAEKPVPAPRPAASSVLHPTSGGGSAVPATRRPSGGTLGADDVVRRPSGGKLSEEDLLPMASRKTSGDPIEVAGIRPDLEAEEARRRAAKRRQQWQEAMEQAGHKARKGNDVAALDVSAVVAEHGKWLQSKGAEGKRATFTGMDLAGVDLSAAILANATFREVDLSDACLAEARLDGSDFRYATLSAADLGGANLGVAAMRHAQLNLSNLEGAVLRGTDLSGARLTGAKTAGADFKGANMMGADLREADLSRAENLTQAQIDKAICDKATRLPPGVFRPLSEEERLG
ncbi:MAG: pentapeptide repeat-containing protein [Magnetospirillum sp.]|nr:pentapeptide repeat-containing protein [Magnetospirillum sp.]